MAIALLITFALSPWVGRLRKLGFRYDRNLITALTGPIGRGMSGPALVRAGGMMFFGRLNRPDFIAIFIGAVLGFSATAQPYRATSPTPPPRFAASWADGTQASCPPFRDAKPTHLPVYPALISSGDTQRLVHSLPFIHTTFPRMAIGFFLKFVRYFVEMPVAFAWCG